MGTKQSDLEPQAARAPDSGNAAAEEMVTVEWDTGLRGIRRSREYEVDGVTYRWDHDGTTRHPRVSMPRRVWDDHREAINDPEMRRELGKSRFRVVTEVSNGPEAA